MVGRCRGARNKVTRKADAAGMQELRASSVYIRTVNVESEKNIVESFLIESQPFVIEIIQSVGYLFK